MRKVGVAFRWVPYSVDCSVEYSLQNVQYLFLALYTKLYVCSTSNDSTTTSTTAAEAGSSKLQQTFTDDLEYLVRPPLTLTPLKDRKEGLGDIRHTSYYIHSH